MESEEKYIGWDKAKEDSEETIISSWVKWANPPEDPEKLQETLEWIKGEIIKGLLMEYKIYLYGKSPIDHCKELVQKINPIGSCICCKHWRINLDRTQLIGMCEQTFKDSNYDSICGLFEEIKGEK